MDQHVSASDARLSLDLVEHRRRQVAAEIGVPGWYWASMASGWVVLGLLAAYAPAWLAATSTLVFGAVHAALASRFVSGRQRSGQVRVSRELVGRRVTWVVLGFLVAMTAATVALALVLDADGARHPAVLASVVVALLVLVGGPGLVAWAGGRAVRRAAA